MADELTELRNRLQILEKSVTALSERSRFLEVRAEIVAESFRKLLKTVQDITWQISGVVGDLNDALRTPDQPIFIAHALEEVRKTLDALDSVIQNLPTE